MSTATRTKSKHLALAAAALLLALGCSVLTGCGDKVPVIGDPAAGMKISVTNGTGTTIDSLQVKDSTDAKYGEPLAMDKYLDTEQSADLYWDVEPNVNYDIAFTSINGGQYELHNVPLNDVSNAILKISPSTQLGYLEYTSLSLGDDINMLPDEKAYDELTKYQATFKSITLKLSHATIKANGEKYQKGDTLKASDTKKLVFTVQVKDGYTLESVSASYKGEPVKVKEDLAEGTYTISAKNIKDGLVIRVKTTENAYQEWTDYGNQDDNGNGGSGDNGSKKDPTPSPKPDPTPTPKPDPTPDPSGDDDSGTGEDCTDDF